ncbi:MAG: hypothetical protein J6B99_06655 [Oscillospiraceae bacterium]|nr:hypothetical protein [Oscillospiraceae bacterium]
MAEMSRYRGRRSGGSSRPISFIIALFVAIAAIVLVIINVTQDKAPADDVVDDTQQGDVTPDDTLPDEGDDTVVEDEPQHVVIEVQGDEERYDAVYRVGDTGYEMYTYVESTAKKYADNINAIADAVEGTATVYMLPAPLSSGITLPDALYGKDIFSDQKAAEDGIIGFMNDNVVSVPLNKAMMAHRGEYIYFRTDHHWTATGAYYAYVEFCKLAGKTPTPLESFETEEFPGFLGTFYRDTNESRYLGDNPDTVVAYHPLSTEATLDYTDKNGQVIRWPIIYDQSNAPASYKYGTFVGGDQPYTIIKNPALTDGSSCVVVKESFGNAFVPFLVDHYETVHVIDYRYWDGSVSDFVKTNGVDDVLFVNNLSAIRSSVLVGYLHDIL